MIADWIEEGRRRAELGGCLRSVRHDAGSPRVRARSISRLPWPHARPSPAPASGPLGALPGPAHGAGPAACTRPGSQTPRHRSDRGVVLRPLRGHGSFLGPTAPPGCQGHPATDALWIAGGMPASPAGLKRSRWRSCCRFPAIVQVAAWLPKPGDHCTLATDTPGGSSKLTQPVIPGSTIRPRSGQARDSIAFSRQPSADAGPECQKEKSHVCCGRRKRAG